MTLPIIIVTCCVVFGAVSLFFFLPGTTLLFLLPPLINAAVAHHGWVFNNPWEAGAGVVGLPADRCCVGYCVCCSSQGVLGDMATFDIGVFASNPSLTVLDKCKKSDLHVIADYYVIVVSRSLPKAELSAVLLESLLSRGVLSLLAPGDVSQVVVWAEASPGVGRLGADELSVAEGRSGHPTGEASSQPVGFTPGAQGDKVIAKPVTLPSFVNSWLQVGCQVKNPFGWTPIRKGGA